MLPVELIVGKYYEIIYNQGYRNENIYLTKCTRPNHVESRFINGVRKNRSGGCKGADSIIEITKEHFETGISVPLNNAVAKQFLSAEYDEVK